MSLPTFHAFSFLKDNDGESIMILRNTEDGSISWTGKLGSDDVLESLKGATSDMVTTKNEGPYRTAYGVLESLS